MYLGDSSNWNIPAMALLANSLGDGISVKGVDYKEQEDARLVTWSVNGRATLDIKTQRAIDIGKMANGDYALKINWRLDETPENLAIGMGCGDGCGAMLELQSVANTNNDTWTTTEIPVSCFVGKGLKADTVNKILSLSATGEGKVTIYSAEISKGSKTTACPG